MYRQFLLGNRSNRFVRQSQIENTLKLTRVAALGGLFNACVATIAIWPAGHNRLITIWAAAVIAVTVARIVHWRHVANTSHTNVNCTRDLRIICGIGLANGILWGLAIALAGIIASPDQFNILAMLSGGMMGAAVMTYGPLPRAAFSYILPLTIGCLAAWAVSPHASTLAGLCLIVSYVLVLGRTILANERIFVAKVEGDIELREAGATVQLLLNDYEAQSSDWLWEVDPNGCIANPSERFAQACRRDTALLGGLPVASLFDHAPERDMLIDYLAGHHPFRALTLKLTVASGPHWWTLSARPHEDGGMRGVASDVTAQKRAEARVSYMAHHDGLTDLANRFLFNDTLAHTLLHLHAGEQVAIMCLDLDQFKSVNDTLGHPIGDKLLREAARRIEAIATEGDLVARLGGDEFAMLICGTECLKGVERCAQKIIDAMEKPFILDGMQVMVSASIGVTIATSADRDATELMKQADLALYSAKTNGRNRYAYFEAGMDKAACARRELEMDLRAAIVAGEFELHYQPLVNLESGNVVSYEALIRWNHPTRGVVMPNEFIALAEETGLIIQLGEWVIREAVREAAKWPPPDARLGESLAGADA